MSSFGPSVVLALASPVEVDGSTLPVVPDVVVPGSAVVPVPVASAVVVGDIVSLAPPLPPVAVEPEPVSDPADVPSVTVEAVLCAVVPEPVCVALSELVVSPPHAETPPLAISRIPHPNRPHPENLRMAPRGPAFARRGKA